MNRNTALNLLVAVMLGVGAGLLFIAASEQRPLNPSPCEGRYAPPPPTCPTQTKETR